VSSPRLERGTYGLKVGPGVFIGLLLELNSRKTGAFCPEFVGVDDDWDTFQDTLNQSAGLITGVTAR